MEFKADKFFNAFRDEFGSLEQSQVDGLNSLLQFVKEDNEITNIKWLAYILATIKHETADTFLPIKEYGTDAYFNNRYDNRKDLGNAYKGDGARYCGRGFVQITGRANYKKFTPIVGVDLEVHPEKALDPAIAYKIMSYGMRNGSFTGVGLARFINDGKTDYLNARKIINSLDRAEKIANYAKKFEVILAESMV